MLLGTMEEEEKVVVHHQSSKAKGFSEQMQRWKKLGSHAAASPHDAAPRITDTFHVSNRDSWKPNMPEMTVSSTLSPENVNKKPLEDGNLGNQKDHKEEIHDDVINVAAASIDVCNNTTLQLGPLKKKAKMTSRNVKSLEERKNLVASLIQSFDIPEPKYLPSEKALSSLEGSLGLPQQELEDDRPPEASTGDFYREDDDDDDDDDDDVDSDEEVRRHADSLNRDSYQQHARFMARQRYLNATGKAVDGHVDATKAKAKQDSSKPFQSEMAMKMLMKMGWKEGQGLGKDASGLKEPIQTEFNSGTRGLGATKR